MSSCAAVGVQQQQQQRRYTHPSPIKSNVISGQLVSRENVSCEVANCFALVTFVFAWATLHPSQQSLVFCRRKHYINTAMPRSAVIMTSKSRVRGWRMSQQARSWFRSRRALLYIDGSTNSLQRTLLLLLLMLLVPRYNPSSGLQCAAAVHLIGWLITAAS